MILNARANEIVYAFQVPLPRDERVLRMHRFFQTMTAIMQLQVLFPPSIKPDRDYHDEDWEEKHTVEYNETLVKHSITMRTKLAHHSSSQLDDEWIVFANGHLSKEFSCIQVSTFNMLLFAFYALLFGHSKQMYSILFIFIIY